MKLENLESKEQVFNDFFSWLFEDSRVISEDIHMEKEIDLTLVSYYKDANIYFPMPIFNFFNTTAMKRLGRISQLDLAIDIYPNAYHNRLEHSKGAYYRKLEELFYNYQNKSWREYISNHQLKLYLIAELIKVAGHDIGHFPLSHAMEQQLFSCHGAHEVITKRIMLEDLEINSLLISISPDLPDILKELFEKDILNFKEHDESNYDIDRLDYLSRDSLYSGYPEFLPFLNYESVKVDLNSLGLPVENNDNSISTSGEGTSCIDVYDYSSLSDIEHFLELRTKKYQDMYFASQTCIREETIGAFFNAFNKLPSQCGANLRKFITNSKSTNLSELDLNSFLEWDDIKFYQEVLDVAEHHENPNVRDLSKMTLPNMESFLKLLYSHLQIRTKGTNYSPSDYEFLKNIKRIIQSNDSFATDLKNVNFLNYNTIIFPPDKPLPIQFANLIHRGLISSYTSKIVTYKSSNPLYIRDESGKIFELSKHPNRKCNWENKVITINSKYTYVPVLRENGVSEEIIDSLRCFCTGKNTFSDSQQDFGYSFNMNPLQVDKNIEDVFLEI